MEKIIFEDLPSTKTPLNAENLNKIQTNAENAINEVDNKFNYSTEEQVVGTYLGKPLYRKVVPVNFSTSSTSAETPHGISNIGYICKQNLNWFDKVDKVWYEQNKDAGVGDYFIKIDFVTSTNIVIKQNAYNWQSRTSDRYCILEYTKTTDTAL